MRHPVGLDDLQKAWLPILLMSVSAVGGQLLFTHGYAYTSLTLGSLLSLSVPLLAALGGWLIFDEVLTPHFLAGAALVMLACAVLGLREKGADEAA